MVGDTCEYVGEPGLWIDVVEAGRLYKRVEDRGALAAAIRSAEQPRLPSKRYAAQGPFGGVVREADAPILKEPRKRLPAAACS
jgi:hypothetical protein